MAKRDRPLNVLIITGAGASANLGVDDTALPMMKGWAADLIPRLGYAASQLGLTLETDGPAFEAIIGRFLNFSRALPAVQALGFMGDLTNLFGAAPPQASGANFAAWNSTAQQNIALMNTRLWESLWENFGRDRVDSEKADNAYSALHYLIRESRGDGLEPCYIAHVTTNFDPAIEVAVQESTYPGTVLLDGFAPASGNARPKWAPNLLTAGRLDSDGRIPVVHIHGAVGWYFEASDQNRILRRPSDDDYDPRLLPALLLPDDTKRPDLFPAPLVQVWEQFQNLLREATHVFVIGHSLHDAYLVNAINDAKVPTAVMTLGKASITAGSSTKPLGHPSQQRRVTQWDIRDSKEAERIKKAIPGATMIPGDFGRGADHPDFDTDTFTKWLDRN